jgi:hypothetical protein
MFLEMGLYRSRIEFLTYERLAVLNSEKVPFRLLHIKKLLLKP